MPENCRRGGGWQDAGSPRGAPPRIDPEAADRRTLRKRLTSTEVHQRAAALHLHRPLSRGGHGGVRAEPALAEVSLVSRKMWVPRPPAERGSGGPASSRANPFVDHAGASRVDDITSTHAQVAGVASAAQSSFRHGFGGPAPQPSQHGWANSTSASQRGRAYPRYGEFSEGL